MAAINWNGVDAAESIGAVIAVIKIAVLNEEVIALFITKASDCIVISWITDEIAPFIASVVVDVLMVDDEVITELIAMPGGSWSD